MNQSNGGAGYTPGRVVDRFEMKIEMGKIREFAGALHDENPLYLDPSAPAPLTFAVTYAFWGRDQSELFRDLGIDTERALHGEEDLHLFRPLRAGMRLKAVTRLVGRDEAEGGRGGKIIRSILETTFTQDGEVVALERRTILETGTPFELQ